MDVFEIAAAYGLPLLALTLGWIAHLYTSAREMSAALDRTIWPWEFVRLRPMRTIISAFGAVGGFFLLFSFELATDPGYAFAVGFLADLILDSMRGLVSARLGVPVGGAPEDTK